MHRDWRFWVGAFFMAGALAIYVLSATSRGFHTVTGFPESRSIAGNPLA
jgi:hypothetical protein